jgi:hypothetical protein
MRPKTATKFYEVEKAGTIPSNPGPGAHATKNYMADGHSNVSKFKRACVPGFAHDMKPGPKKYDRIPGGE